MMTHRFFVSPESLGSGHALIEGQTAYQISKVLRMVPGDHVTLLDGVGLEYLVKLDDLQGIAITGTIVDVSQGCSEPPIQITLCQGILKGQKFEFVLQKGTELGITKFIPVICDRSIPKYTVTINSQRMKRWRKITTEASEQCGRTLLPEISLPVNFRTLCEHVDPKSLCLISWEQARNASLKKVLTSSDHSSIWLFIGPEGGFREEEVKCAAENGIIPVSLGKTILRAETAGLVASTAILYEFGALEN